MTRRRLVFLLAGGVLVTFLVAFAFYLLFGGARDAWSPAVQATFTLALLLATGYYAWQTQRLVEKQANPLDIIRAKTKEQTTSELLELLGNYRPVLEGLARHFPLDMPEGAVPAIPTEETDAVSNLATSLQARSHPLHTYPAVAIYAFAQALQLAVSQVDLLRHAIRDEQLRSMKAQEAWSATGAESAYGQLRNRLQATWTWSDMVHGSVVQQAVEHYKVLVEYLAGYFHSGMKDDPREPPRSLLGLPETSP